MEKQLFLLVCFLFFSVSLFGQEQPEQKNSFIFLGAVLAPTLTWQLGPEGQGLPPIQTNPLMLGGMVYDDPLGCGLMLVWSPGKVGGQFIFKKNFFLRGVADSKENLLWVGGGVFLTKQKNFFLRVETSIKSPIRGTVFRPHFSVGGILPMGYKKSF